MSGDYNSNPVGALEIGATLKVEPTIEVKEKDELSQSGSRLIGPRRDKWKSGNTIFWSKALILNVQNARQH
jgi:hypothetical protein